MALSRDTRLGGCESIALLGSGGMGDVYRARGTKLRRDVAIKILPANVAADPDRIARSEGEEFVLDALTSKVRGIHDFARGIQYVADGTARRPQASRFVGALLFGVDARDPMTLVAAAAALVSVGLFAGWLPAPKVSRLDPTTALRT
jgi:hypothetical protein